MTTMGIANQGIAANAPPPNKVMSRIDHDIERVKELTRRVNGTTERILMHARSIGYWSDPPSDKINQPAAVITTLFDALQELERAVDANSGSLNVFD